MDNISITIDQSDEKKNKQLFNDLIEFFEDYYDKSNLKYLVEDDSLFFEVSSSCVIGLSYNYHKVSIGMFLI